MGAKVACLKPERIERYEDNFRLEIKIINCTTYTEKIRFSTAFTQPLEIISQLKSDDFDGIKGVLFCFCDYYLEKPRKIAKALEGYFTELNIPFYCCMWDSIFYSSMLFATVEKFGKTSLPNIFGILLIYGYQDSRILTIEKKEDFYFLSDMTSIHERSFHDPTNDFKKCSTIFVHYYDGDKNWLKRGTYFEISQLYNSNTYYEVTKSYSKYINKAIVAKILKLNGKENSPCDFATFSGCEFHLSAWESRYEKYIPQHLYESRLISVKMFDIVPFKKTIAIYQELKKVVCVDIGQKLYQDSGTPAFPEIGMAVTFLLDSFFIPHAIAHQPKNPVDDVVMIHMDYQEFSVEIIKKGKLESIGLDKIPLMIGFVDGGVQIGYDALKVKETHNSFVVCDLLSLASFGLSRDDDFKEKRGYKIIDEFLVFDTFRGRRKARVSFLIAIIIKWAVAKAELKLERKAKTVVLTTDRLRDGLRYELTKAFKCAKLEQNDLQMHQFKIVEIENQ